MLASVAAAKFSNCFPTWWPPSDENKAQPWIPGAGDPHREKVTLALLALEAAWVKKECLLLEAAWRKKELPMEFWLEDEKHEWELYESECVYRRAMRAARWRLINALNAARDRARRGDNSLSVPSAFLS